DSVINQILEMARWAPSGANSQPWEFIVVKDKAVKDKVVAIAQEAVHFVQKLEVTRDKEAQHPNAHRRLADYGFKDAPVLIVIIGDRRARQAQVLAAQLGPQSYLAGLAYAELYMHLAVTTLGLGSQWLTSPSDPSYQALIKDVLKIPRYFNLFDIFVLGYPAESPGPRTVRKLEEMVHTDHYDITRGRKDAEVKQFARKIQLEQ
ncbi:MAG: nitroreductase family protein, partial [Dehalococcoidia bacterium]|nr:nitroreductase family protein [Dehalococcoidia bacterium]